MNRWQAFSQLVLARFREFYREPEAVFWVYGFPLILAIGLGIAFSDGKPELPLVDVQGSAADLRAQELARLLQTAGLKAQILSPAECRRRLNRGRTALFLVPGSDDAPEFVYDQARSDSVLARHWVAEVLLRSRPGNAAFQPRDSLVHEPGSRYIDFLLPGLIGMNLMGGGLFGIGFVLVDMRVRKLFKRLLATPLHHIDFLFSIFASRLAFLVPEMLSLFLAGFFLFGVPIHGDWLALILIILLGALTFGSLGLLLGCRTEKTETASGLINLVMLPMYLLSGVFFSSRRFPDSLQPFIQALPLTQVNDALREVMLEGQSLPGIAWRLAILLAWTAVCLPLAIRWFRWR